MVLLFLGALGIYSLRSRGRLYRLYLLGDVIALFCGFNGSLTIGVVCLVGGWTTANFGISQRGLGICILCGVLLGISCALLLVGRVPGWVFYVLPVGGIHARRLLAGAALAGLMGPAIGSVALSVAPLEIPLPRPLGVMIGMLSQVACLAPLWDVMVRGWSPGAELS